MSTGYVTVEEANNYVEASYMSTDELRISWESLNALDKEVVLTRACQEIDMLPFHGRKSSIDQEYAFPRYPSATVPQVVKNAQVEHALTLVASDTSSDADMYEKLWTMGVRSYSIGSVSESFGQPTSGGSLALEYGIQSIKAQRLLKPFITGGYRI